MNAVGESAGSRGTPHAVEPASINHPLAPSARQGGSSHRGSVPRSWVMSVEKWRTVEYDVLVHRLGCCLAIELVQLQALVPASDCYQKILDFLHRRFNHCSIDVIAIEDVDSDLSFLRFRNNRRGRERKIGNYSPVILCPESKARLAVGSSCSLLYCLIVIPLSHSLGYIFF